MTSYRESVEHERARSVAFAALSADTQRRLRSALGDRDEILLADWHSLHGGPWHWGALGGLGLGLAAYALSHRFGDLTASPRPPMLQGAWAALGCAVAAVGALMAAQQRKAPSVPRGVFVLPRDLIDTRGERIKVVPLSTLISATDSGKSLLLTFDEGLLYRFENAHAASFQKALHDATQAFEQASARRDLDALRRADPFLAQRSSWPSGDSASSAEGSPLPRLLVAALVAALAGFAAAGPLQKISDRVGIERAERESDDDALRGYAERGGGFADQTDAARLAIALKSTDTGALLRYLASGRRRAEAETALIGRISAAPDEETLARCLALTGRVRDAADALFFALATEQNSEPLMRSYIRHGGSKAELVESRLLPEMLLRQAIASRDVPMLKVFARSADEASDDRLLHIRTSEAMRKAASDQLAAIHRQELDALRATFASTPLTQQLFRLIEATSSPWRSARIRFYSERRQRFPTRDYDRPYIVDVPPTFASSFGDLAAGQLQVEFVDDDFSDTLPAGFDGQIRIIYDDFRSLTARNLTVFGTISFASRDARLEVPFRLHCLPLSARRAPLELIRESFRDLLSGRSPLCSTFDEFKLPADAR